MKTWKQLTVVAILAIFALVFIFIACDDKTDLPEQPKEQEDSITFTINFPPERTYTATIKGYFTNYQWDGVADRIQTAFRNLVGDLDAEDALHNAFRDDNVVIMVEKTTEYKIYKTVVGNKTTLYVNINGLNNLQSKIEEAAKAMRNGESKME